MGLGLSDFLRLRSLAASGAPLSIPNSQDKAVIFVWLPGGPSQLDTYDMKPDAPSEFRGDFRPIRTNVPGIDICELFPGRPRLPTASRWCVRCATTSPTMAVRTSAS